MTAQADVTQLVVIGSSAGGIDALSTLVATLPADFPAPLVVAQHLDPGRPSHLADILSRRSPLPVQVISGNMPLSNGVIFIVPSNRDVEITNRTVTVHAHDGRSAPSIDLLLSSAAVAFGESLIAAILSGTGSDGAAGARAVKQAGGMVVIQNPQSAQFPEMPAAIAPPLVDVVAEIGSIGRLLRDLLTGASITTPPDQNRTLRILLQKIHDVSNIDFSQYKMPTIQRRIQRRMAATGLRHLTEYIAYVDNHPEEYERLVGAFLIKVTEFFRDPELFAYLRTHIIPELIATGRRHNNELRLWSAGCATGEEAYSLAILVAETLGDELEMFTVRIFATDLDLAAITYARRGIYPATALAGVSPDLVERYFSPYDNSYEVSKKIRGLVVFGEHDLAQRAPFPRIDLCLCRNVLIYFTAELQRRALQLFAFSLRNAGYLVLGKAETPNVLAEFFDTMHPQLRLYQRHGERLLIPPVQLKESSPLSMTPANTRRSSMMRNVQATASLPQRTHQRTTSEQEAELFRTLPVGVIVIDHHYDIQTINHAARSLLGIHGPVVGEDLVHLSDRLAIPALRSTLDDVLKLRTERILETEQETVQGHQRFLQLICRPLDQHELGRTAANTPERQVIILVIDTTTARLAQLAQRTSHEAGIQTLQQSEQHLQTELHRVEARLQRLLAANAELESANERLNATNAELHSVNEEFMVGNEETQAAMEEVATLNEELQATNEELETLNEELQATNEELNTTNDDLGALNREMHALADDRAKQSQISETERARLQAVLLSMGEAVLEVDSHQQVRLTNAAVQRLFGPQGTDFVPQDEQGHPLPVEETPRYRAAHGETFTMTFTLLGSDGLRHWFEAIGGPLRYDGKEQGGIIVIRDITDRSLLHLQEEFLALVSHELRTPLTPISGYLQMLRRLLRKDPANTDTTVQRYLDLMQEHLRNLQRLISDLLDIGRLQEGKLRLIFGTVDLVLLINELVEALQLASGNPPLHLGVTASSLVVRGDMTRLSQVILNLLTNAMQHAPHSPQIDIRLYQDNHDAVLDVQDYGPGIAESVLPHLFERFYQGDAANDHAGLGLGLYIAHELVNAHNGQISVQSVTGEGTTFIVRLPLLDHSVPEASDTTSSAAGDDGPVSPQ